MLFMLKFLVCISLNVIMHYNAYITCLLSTILYWWTMFVPYETVFKTIYLFPFGSMDGQNTKYLSLKSSLVDKQHHHHHHRVMLKIIHHLESFVTMIISYHIPSPTIPHTSWIILPKTIILSCHHISPSRFSKYTNKRSAKIHFFEEQL